MKASDIIEPTSKNRYEESIKNFADALDQKIQFLKQKKNDVDESLRNSYQEKIDLMADKRDFLKDKMRNIKATSEEKWKEVASAVDAELRKVSEEAEEAYTGLRNGFSYLFETLAKEVR